MRATGVRPPTRGRRVKLSVVPRTAKPGAERTKPAPPRHAQPGAAPTTPDYLRDSYAATAFAEVLDRSLHAAIARFTTGVSPMTLIGAYADWAAHLAYSPGKQLQLSEKALRKTLRLANYAGRRAASPDGCEPCIEPLPQDRRFLGEAWRQAPYDLVYQSFLLVQQWWHNATTGVHGVNAKNEKIVLRHAAMARRLFPVEPLPHQSRSARAHRAEGGMNLVRGARTFSRTSSARRRAGKRVGIERSASATTSR